MKNYIVGLLVVFSVNFMIGQSTFSYGPELTLATNQLWNWDSKKLTNGTYSETDFPLPGIGLGFHGQLEFQNRVTLSSSIGYQMTGSRFHSIREETIPRDKSRPVLYTYTSENWRKLTMHKIRVPLTIGYKLDNSKYKPTFFLGGSVNWLFYGKYKEKGVHKRSDGIGSSTYVTEYNPIDADISLAVDPILFQGLVGMSSQFGKNVKASLTYSYGGLHEFISYGECGPWICNLGPYGRFSNSELGLSFVWLLNTKIETKE